MFSFHTVWNDHPLTRSTPNPAPTHGSQVKTSGLTTTQLTPYNNPHTTTVGKIIVLHTFLTSLKTPHTALNSNTKHTLKKSKPGRGVETTNCIILLKRSSTFHTYQLLLIFPCFTDIYGEEGNE